MRAPTPTERLLGLGLVVAVVFIGTLVFFRWTSGKIQSARAGIAELKLQISSFEALLLERPYWEARGAWISGNPMEAYTGRDADARFVESVQASTQEQGLEIVSQKPEEPERAGDLTIATFDLVLRGELEPLVRWLWNVQRPGSYLVVESFTLKRADESTTMEMRVLLRKIFRANPVAMNP